MTKAAPRNPWQPAKPRRAQALHRILAFGAPLVPGTALAADGLARMLGITSVAAVALLLLLVLALSLRNRELRATRRALKMALAERDPILSALPDLIWFKDASGVYLSCNTAFAEVVDCNQSAIAGKTDLQLLDPTTARQWRSHHRHAIEAGRAVEVEEWLAVSQSGYTALLLATRRPVYGTDGRLVGVLGVARDVTALRTAEDQSRRQASYQRALLNTFPHMAWMKDVEGRYLAVNQAYVDAVDAGDADALVRKTDLEIWPRQLAEEFRADDRDVMRNGRKKEAEVRIARPGGDAWFEVFKAPIIDDRGELLGTVGFARDVSERRQMEQALRDSERHFREFFERHSAAMLFVDPATQSVVDANQAAVAFYGYPRGQLVGMHIDTFNTLPADEVESLVQAAAHGDIHHFELQHRLASGDLRDVEVYSALIDQHGQPLLMSIIHDVSARKHAQRELEYERNLFASGPVVAINWSAAPGWPVRYVSANCANVLGHSVAQLSDPARPFVDFLHPDDREPFIAGAEAFIARGTDRFEQSYRLMRADGDPLWIRAVVELMRDPAGGVEMIRGFLSDQSPIKQLELALTDQRRRLGYVIEGTGAGTWEWNVQTGETRFNERWAEMLGYRLGELVPVSIDTWTRLAHPDDLERSNDLLRRYFAGETERYECEARMRHKDGHWVWVADRGRVFEWSDDGKPLWMYGTHLDITAHKQAELAMQAETEHLRLAEMVFNRSHEGIVVTDAEAHIIDVNRGFTEITGYTRDEAIGKNPNFLSSGHQDKAFYAAMWQTLNATGHWSGEIWNRRKNGSVFAETLSISAVIDSGGRVQRYVALFSDITVLKEQQSQLEHIAYFDALTDLPNRVLLVDRLHNQMQRADRQHTHLAVVFLDLDGFKEVNDEHGHDAGDRALVQIATRLRQSLRDEDTVARLGGDEFVVILGGLDDPTDCVSLLPRLLSAVATPLEIDAESLTVSASLGISLYPQREPLDPDQLLRQTDQAMYQAKLAGKNRYHFFDDEQDRDIRDRVERIDAVRHALQNDELALHYQPKVNMRSGDIVGVEALIRWPQADGSVRMPGEFLPLIEHTPLIAELDDWVLHRALGQLSEWDREGLHLSVSVNISARHLQQEDFHECLRRVLALHPEIAPGRLVIEVLETTALMDLKRMSRVIRASQDMGVLFALDDFGTGYSSLEYLKNLPARQLKVDRGFVHDMLDDRDDLAILEGIVGLATAFRRELVAEGVEQVEQGEILIALGCELAQGFGIGRPMPPAQLVAWAEKWQPHERWRQARPVARDDLPLIFAMVEHRAWVKALQSQLNGRQLPEPEMVETACQFGRWLEKEGGLRYAGRNELDAVRGLHHRIHRLGPTILAQHREGEQALAEDGLDSLVQLRDELLAQLRSLLHGSP